MRLFARLRPHSTPQDDGRAAFERKLRIASLEHEFEISSTDAALDGLPHVRVVRNPNGSEWRAWVALGFPGDDYFLSTFENGYLWAHTEGKTQDECLRCAIDRLYGIYLARREDPLDVS